MPQYIENNGLLVEAEEYERIKESLCRPGWRREWTQVVRRNKSGELETISQTDPVLIWRPKGFLEP